MLLFSNSPLAKTQMMFGIKNIHFTCCTRKIDTNESMVMNNIFGKDKPKFKCNNLCFYLHLLNKSQPHGTTICLYVKNDVIFQG
jgi:hypothetical protein